MKRFPTLFFEKMIFYRVENLIKYFKLQKIIINSKKADNTSPQYSNIFLYLKNASIAFSQVLDELKFLHKLKAFKIKTQSKDMCSFRI